MKFHINRIIHQGAANVFLDGRNIDGVIRVGSRFKLRLKPVFKKTPSGDFLGSTEYEQIGVVDIVVMGIELYKKSFPEISDGMTGRLIVSVPGGIEVKEGETLSD